ncbi:aminoglycoside phosphotransferase family protein [Breznakiellaceae bacterium SP9]
MKNIIFVYDDGIKPDVYYQKAIGNLSFANIFFRKKTNISRVFDMIDSYGIATEKILLDGFSAEGLSRNRQTAVIYLFSYAAVINDAQFELLIKKLAYSVSNIIIAEDELPLLLYFTGVDDYNKYLSTCNEITLQEMIRVFSFVEIENNCFLNIKNHANFNSLFSGNFDTRFFNSLHSSKYTITKKSIDREKIKKEYSYYRLLPDNTKTWFVMPYNYQENNVDGTASYDMERLYVPDMSRRWIHNAIGIGEFEQFLDKIFYYLDSRDAKTIDTRSYMVQQKSLYVDKVEERLHKLRELPVYDALEKYAAASSGLGSIDKLHALYREIYTKIAQKNRFTPIAVLGHGDLCFSNILYDNDSNILKFIDPKGALTTDDLWTDPYYDAAKLSHSICGQYDYINNGLFNIQIDDDMDLKLATNTQNTDSYKAAFIAKLSDHGFDYAAVRTFEASLFISMVPLHADNVLKCLAFILNAANILKEVQACLK